MVLLKHHLNRMPSVSWDNLLTAMPHPHIKPSLGSSILATIRTSRRAHTKSYFLFRFGERGDSAGSQDEGIFTCP
jgi:hypothetical protein